MDFIKRMKEKAILYVSRYGKPGRIRYPQTYGGAAKPILSDTQSKQGNGSEIAILQLYKEWYAPKELENLLFRNSPLAVAIRKGRKWAPKPKEYGWKWNGSLWVKVRVP